MTAQENVDLSRSVIDLYNSHQSEPNWLEKIVAAALATLGVVLVQL